MYPFILFIEFIAIGSEATYKVIHQDKKEKNRVNCVKVKATKHFFIHELVKN